MKENIPYLTIADNFRVFKCDQFNLEVEMLTLVKSAPNRYQSDYKTVERWKSIGYTSTLSGAIRIILKQEMLDNLRHDLQSTLQNFEDKFSAIIDSVAKSGITKEHFPLSYDDLEVIDVVKLTGDNKNSDQKVFAKVKTANV
jgi:hypothetical protein